MQANRLRGGARLLSLAAAIMAVAAMLTFRAHLASAHQYLVEEGDTLSGVAARFGVTARSLAEANGITDPNRILAGQLLVVPSDGRSATEYLVRHGDNLWTISDKVGVPVGDLARANGLDDPDWVPAGRLLSIPALSSVSSGGSVTVGQARAGSSRYTVKAGDDLSTIALRLGVSVDELATANDITDPNFISVGQVIVVPNQWTCPVPSATFVNDYGLLNPDTPTAHFHHGIDLFAPAGTPVLAPVGGRVERFPNPSGGLAVMLHGTDGNRYYLAHLSDYGETGRVTGGTVIGYVGNTGDARLTSPHLHFVIHPGGWDPTVNPFPTLVAACR